jgi:hypothetical protein
MKFATLSALFLAFAMQVTFGQQTDQPNMYELFNIECGIPSESIVSLSGMATVRRLTEVDVKDATLSACEDLLTDDVIWTAA